MSTEVDLFSTNHKAEKYDAKSFLSLGTKMLADNTLPQNVIMSAISNTPIGIDMFLIGLARSQTQEIANLLEAMSSLESKIFNKDEIEKANPYERINLLNLAQKSFDFRMKFIEKVQQNTDWNRLQTNLLELSSKLDKSSIQETDSETQKVLKSKMVDIINNEFKKMKMVGK